MTKHLIKFYITTLFLIISLFLSFGCTREEAPAPLPPPIKQVQISEQPDRTKITEQVGTQLLKTETLGNLSNQNVIGEDCESVCNRILECVNGFVSSKIFDSRDSCMNKCNSLPAPIKQAIVRAKDCSIVRCNINRYLCDFACNNMAKCNQGTIPKQMGSSMSNCLKGCMDMFLMSDRVSKTVSCFAKSENCSNLSSCVGEDISPARDINDYCK